MNARVRQISAILGACCGTLHWSPAPATAYSWVGATTNWTTASNWAPNGIPGTLLTDTAVFPVSSSTSVALSAPVIVAMASITTLDVYQFSLAGTLRLAQGMSTANASPFFAIAASGSLILDGGNSSTSAMTNHGFLQFRQNASASASSINNSGGTLQFRNNSTAAQAMINNTGTIQFLDSPIADQASIQQQGGLIDFSGLASPITVGAISGNIASPGSIHLGNASVSIGSLNFDTTLPDVISGNSGTLTKVGTGSLQLSGNSTYTGTTTVQSGTLAVIGSLTSLVAVNAGTALVGNGTVAGVSNAGMLGPIGTLTINGLLFDLPGATTNVTVDGAGSSDQAVVNGMALLNGTLHIEFVGGTPPPDTTYTLLSASTGVLGSFSACTTNMPLAGTLHQNPNSVTFVTLPAEEIFRGDFETPFCD